MSLSKLSGRLERYGLEGYFQISDEELTLRQPQSLALLYPNDATGDSLFYLAW